MADEIDVYLDSENTGCYVESLIKSRRYVTDNKAIQGLLDLVILEELEVALIGAQKTKSETLKLTKNNIVPLK